MDAPAGQLLPWVMRLADALPGGVLQTLARAIAACPPQQWNSLHLQVTQIVPQPQLRSLVLDMLAAWQQHTPALLPTDVALMLQTAAATTRRIRETQTVELVWTGPLVAGPAMRRTDQALLEVIASARQTLLIVSFAVYKVPAIGAAIVESAQRGVAIRICVEAPEPSGQTMAYDTIRALGPDVAQRAAIYGWPGDQRPIDPHGRAGVLHAKCAVADRELLFISSANLTDYAMNLNMELGVLIHSAVHAARVAAQFEQMIAQGLLRPMPVTLEDHR